MQQKRHIFVCIAHPEDEGVEKQHRLEAEDDGPGFHPPGSHNPSDTGGQTQPDSPSLRPPSYHHPSPPCHPSICLSVCPSTPLPYFMPPFSPLHFLKQMH